MYAGRPRAPRSWRRCQRGRTRGQRADRPVDMACGPAPHRRDGASAAVQPAHQGVVAVSRLCPHADPAAGRADRVHRGAGAPAQRPAQAEQPQGKVGVFAEGPGKALVEPARGDQRAAPVGHVGGDPAGTGQARRASFPVGGQSAGRQRDLDDPLNASDPLAWPARSAARSARQRWLTRTSSSRNTTQSAALCRAPSRVPRGGRAAALQRHHVVRSASARARSPAAGRVWLAGHPQAPPGGAAARPQRPGRPGSIAALPGPRSESLPRSRAAGRPAAAVSPAPSRPRCRVDGHPEAETGRALPGRWADKRCV